MIDNAPQIGNKKPEDWIKEFLGYMTKLRFEFIRVWSIWFPVQGSDLHGKHPGKNVTAGNSAYVSLMIPRGTDEIKQVLVRLIPTVTGTIDWTANLTRGASGADESSGSATKTADGLAVTDDRVTEIDVTTMFSNVVAEDQIGFQFVLDSATTTTDTYILGLVFKYR